MKKIIYLEEGQDTLRNCLECGRSICFLPDIFSSPKPWGLLTVLRWSCYSCEIEFFQTKREFNLNTAEGSEEYLKSEGIDIEQCVKDGLTVINGIKNKLNK